MESYDLCDIWRLRNQNVKRFTSRQKAHLIQRRLDYFLYQMIFEIEKSKRKTIYFETESSSYTTKTRLFFVSNDFQEFSAEVDMLAAVASDHSAIR